MSGWDHGHGKDPRGWRAPLWAEFANLAEELESIEAREPVAGGGTILRTDRGHEIRRRLIDLVGLTLPHEERIGLVRVATHLIVQLATSDRRHAGLIVEVGAGGMLVRTALQAELGALVEIELPPARDGRRVPGAVTGTMADAQGHVGLEIALEARDDVTQARAWELVAVLLGQRVK